ncbi:MAG: YabP/YqfC family sporulation protein [Bacilli bacterium]|nr:YabP/YqfC family sporulation protein [Bacilli bacterium]
MNIINGIRSYILDNDLKITILNNKINIVNYKDIGHFDSNKIIVKTDVGEIIIKGGNLVVSKLMSSEILITGNFSNIEFR